MEAFVYVWTDWVREMLYIGAHKGTVDDGYVCSSDLMLPEYKKRPGDFTRQIVAQGAWRAMLILEQRLILASGAVKDPHYYNQACGLGPYHGDSTGMKLSPEHRAKIRAAKLGNKCALGYKHTPEHMAKIRAAMLGNKCALGYKHTPDAIEKMRAAKLGKTPGNKVPI